jgi:hypothetical protein
MVGVDLLLNAPLLRVVVGALLWSGRRDETRFFMPPPPSSSSVSKSGLIEDVIRNEARLLH